MATANKTLDERALKAGGVAQRLAEAKHDAQLAKGEATVLAHDAKEASRLAKKAKSHATKATDAVKKAKSDLKKAEAALKKAQLKAKQKAARDAKKARAKAKVDARRDLATAAQAPAPEPAVERESPEEATTPADHADPVAVADETPATPADEKVDDKFDGALDAVANQAQKVND